MNPSITTSTTPEILYERGDREGDGGDDGGDDGDDGGIGDDDGDDDGCRPMEQIKPLE